MINQNVRFSRNKNKSSLRLKNYETLKQNFKDSSLGKSCLIHVYVTEWSYLCLNKTKS